MGEASADVESLGRLAAAAGVGSWWGVVGFALGGGFEGRDDLYAAVKLYGFGHGVL